MGKNLASRTGFIVAVLLIATFGIAGELPKAWAKTTPTIAFGITSPSPMVIG